MLFYTCRDVDQLHPSGAGNVLKDIINSGVVDVVWLKEYSGRLLAVQ